MTSVRFIAMTDFTEAAAVLNMMAALYAEDEPAAAPDPGRFPETIRVLLARPEMGRIVLARNGAGVVGYAILIPYWSNEYGGIIVFVDELYVLPAARRRGIGLAFFSFLERERPFDAVAMFLEVSPGNRPARKLYESLGFGERRNIILARRLPKRPT
jgi:ribosomal protein S18 acetylase RimI-like enzyme